MDAVEFIRERDRMMLVVGYAPNASYGHEMSAEEIVAKVEAWSAAHPCKTRQDLFLEQWPDAQLSLAGDIIICPKQLCKGEELYKLMAGCRGTNCDVCRREFYGKTVEVG